VSEVGAGSAQERASAEPVSLEPVSLEPVVLEPVVLRVTEPEDPRLAAYRLLATPAELRRAGWFVAEGRLVVERVLAERRYELESLLLNESALAVLLPALRASGRSPPIYVAPAALFEQLTGFDFHRGCLGLVRRPAALGWRELAARSRALVVLEAVANADNIGGVFRNAAAFGVDGVLLDPSSADPLYRKAVRTSMAATLRVPFATLGADEATPSAPSAARWPECLSELAASGFELIALTPGEGARDLDAFVAAPERAARVALLFGAEGSGLSARALSLCRHRLRIAIRPEIDSLNLAVACGIALQRLLPQPGAAPTR
jgi:tRNA G18 (ribose-2'-O)-methylase SpoU